MFCYAAVLINLVWAPNRMDPRPSKCVLYRERTGCEPLCCLGNGSVFWSEGVDWRTITQRNKRDLVISTDVYLNSSVHATNDVFWGGGRYGNCTVAKSARVLYARASVAQSICRLLGYELDDRNSFPGKGNNAIFFLFPTMSRTTLRPTQFPI